MDGSNPTVKGLWPKEIFDMPSTHQPPKKFQVESNVGNIYPNALISNIASSINFQSSLPNKDLDIQNVQREHGQQLVLSHDLHTLNIQSPPETVL